MNDSTGDVNSHKRLVKKHIVTFMFGLLHRTIYHDLSKLQDPEKPLFDEWIPRLKDTEFGSEEYKDALAKMGEGLKHHYEHNRHHPEHYENGIAGMGLLDVVEMVCDWQAAAEVRGQAVNLDYLADRFKIGDQLLSIISNTLKEE